MDRSAPGQGLRPPILTGISQAGWLAISIGDITGIGPEVALKALASELKRDEAKYLLLGDLKCLERVNHQLKLELPIQAFHSFNAPGRIFVESVCAPLPCDLPHAAPEASRAVVEWLRAGALHCLRGETKAMVTAPVSKEAIIAAGNPGFVGQTEFLSEIAGTDGR